MFELKNRITMLLIRDSFRHTPEPSFLLACGAKSRFYMNCKETDMQAKVMFPIGALVLASLIGVDATAIGGLTFGADPISNSTACVSGLYSSIYLDKKTPLLNSFSVRKELKDHGVIKWIEGPVKKGEKVVIIDDVCTTGGSTIKAIERARIMELEVVAVRIFFDRQEMGGMDKIREHASDVQSIFTLEEILNN